LISVADLLFAIDSSLKTVKKRDGRSMKEQKQNKLSESNGMRKSLKVVAGGAGAKGAGRSSKTVQKRDGRRKRNETN
jgi:hypothetical protein